MKHKMGDKAWATKTRKARKMKNRMHQENLRLQSTVHLLAQTPHPSKWVTSLA